MKDNLTQTPLQPFNSQLHLLAHLVEQTSDVLTAADLDYKPITWNKAAEIVYGITAEQVLGHDIREFIQLEYINTNRAEVREIINTQGEWRGEACFVRPTDGQLITIIINFKLLKNYLEEPQGYLISAIDITERKKTELWLRESENRFRDMADTAPVMIWMNNEHNRTTYLNNRWKEFTGYDIVGRVSEGWSSFVHPDDLPEARRIYQQAFQNQQPVTLVYRMRRKTGLYHWVQDVGAPRFLNDGSFIGYIGSVVDIQDQKHKEEQLKYQATVLENVSDILITTDLAFKINGWNKAAEFYYGIAEKEALGHRMSELIQLDIIDSSFEQVIVALKTNGIWKGEVSIVGNDGERKFFLHTMKNVDDGQGKTIGYLAVGRDITERKKIEEQLLKSEQFYRTLIADSLDGTLLLDAEGRITFSSDAVKHLLGHDAEELKGRNGFEFVHPSDVSWALESFQKEVVENPEVKFITIRLLHKNGDWIWCSVRGHNLLSNPYINSIVVYFHDDTLRKRASDALKESEKRFRNLIRDIPVGVGLQDKEGAVTLCNEALLNMLQLTEEEVISKNIFELITDVIDEQGEQYVLEERPLFKSVHEKKPSKDVVLGILRPKTKDRIWILINTDPVLDDDGEIIHVICSLMDITERKKLEKQLLDDQLHHQKELTKATIDGQEKERTEIGKELHDNIGQQLTTIKLFLDMAKTTADDTTQEMLNMALKGVSDVINEVRAISRSLVPSTLKDLGLIESVQELVDSIGRSQLLQIVFNHDGFDESVLPENQKLTMFRIIQEQMNNVVKHAGARMVFISIVIRNRHVIIDMKDDGRGFDLKKIRRGLGFINIKNRAELFGGKKKLVSAEGKGCHLTISFPLVQKPVGILN